MNFSVVVPVFNEEDNLQLFFAELNKILIKITEKYNYLFEIIFIDDGSYDNSLSLIKDLSNKFKYVNYITLQKNNGQSYALLKGIENSKYNNIITIDADFQNDPSDIPKLLLAYLKDDEVKLVGGLRLKRADSYLKIFSSRIANRVRMFILNDRCLDTGCSLKVFEKKIFLKFIFFKGIHRFLPALFSGYGHKTCFIEVNHRHRHKGVSKYGNLSRMFIGIYHLLYVYFLLKRK